MRDSIWIGCWRGIDSHAHSLLLVRGAEILDLRYGVDGMGCAAFYVFVGHFLAKAATF